MSLQHAFGDITLYCFGDIDMVLRKLNISTYNLLLQASALDY